jgi:hypothetical protein
MPATTLEYLLERSEKRLVGVNAIVAAKPLSLSNLHIETELILLLHKDFVLLQNKTPYMNKDVQSQGKSSPMQEEVSRSITMD